MFYTCNDHAITDVLGKQSSRPAFIFLCSSIFSGNSRIPSYNQWEQDIVFICCYLNLRTSRRRIYIYICLPYSKPKVSLFAGEGGWLIASGNHGLVFLRMIEQQICVREGKRKGRGKENWRERKRRGREEEGKRKRRGKEKWKEKMGLSVVWDHLFEQMGIAKVSL